MQQALLRHEAAGTLTDPDYLAASRVFYLRHVCRLDPWPPEVTRTFDLMDLDSTNGTRVNGETVQLRLLRPRTRTNR